MKTYFHLRSLIEHNSTSSLTLLFIEMENLKSQHPLNLPGYKGNRCRIDNLLNKWSPGDVLYDIRGRLLRNSKWELRLTARIGKE